MKRNLAALATLLAWCATAGARSPNADCSATGRCVTLQEDRQPQRVRIVAQNHATYDVTVTVQFTRLHGIADGVTNPAHSVLGPNESREVAVLTAARSAGRWGYAYDWWHVQGRADAVHDETHAYRLPYEKGRAFSVSQGFNSQPTHTGETAYAIDWTMPEGTPVLAARDGRVVDFEDTCTDSGTRNDLLSEGNFVLIRQSDGTFAEYHHLMPGGVTVRVGQQVRAGDRIGFAGRTGFATGPHLHFMVFRAGRDKKREPIPVRFRTGLKTIETLKADQTYPAFE